MVGARRGVGAGLGHIVRARTGGLIVSGDPDELSFLFSGGIKLDIDYTPALLYQVAKMDGAIVLNANATKIAMANVQLTPDPTILSLETGTRHRTAERVSKQTEALVIAVSQSRSVVSLYLDGAKYILEDIPVVLAKANQALATLDKYRSRPPHPPTRPTAPEPEAAGQGHPGPGPPGQVPQPPRPGAHPPDRARVRGRRDAPRRPHRAPARRARHAHGGGDRALHRRARHRGAPDRDAARGDDGRRRRRQGRARARLPRRSARGHLRRGSGRHRAAAAPGPSRPRAPGRD